uniref:NADH-ubiquinone oxidoreductase chain 6 n=1 Tax=Curculionoidea sp. 25 KM-2017 TaxID=2219409 RepID=A0A346RIB1_9CUCU|nr:NADH dehydrogenase subunit 6 [Curculionoidea sp. 25 KM-2017]
MFIWTMSVIFMFLNHPLSFGSILLIQTIATSMLTGSMNYNYWFSYILFLIMIGGMLILFIYMTSVASNEKFKFSMKILMFCLIMLILTIWIFMLFDNLSLNLNIFNIDLIPQSENLNFTISMNKFMNMPSMMITLLMIIYLLITLIAIVKITEIQHGPMRQKF